MSPNCPNQAMISETSFRCFVPEDGAAECGGRIGEGSSCHLSVGHARPRPLDTMGVTGDSSRQDTSFPDYAQTGWAGRPGHAELCRRHAFSERAHVGCLKRKTLLCFKLSWTCVQIVSTTVLTPWLVTAMFSANLKTFSDH